MAETFKKIKEWINQFFGWDDLSGPGGVNHVGDIRCLVAIAALRERNKND